VPLDSDLLVIAPYVRLTALCADIASERTVANRALRRSLVAKLRYPRRHWS